MPDKKPNPWLAHVKAFRAANVGTPAKTMLTRARATYTPSETAKSRAPRTQESENKAKIKRLKAKMVSLGGSCS
jgi:hypothetical protein